MKKISILMMAVCLMSSCFATENQTSKPDIGQEPPIYAGWKLNKYKNSPLCQSFDKYLNEFPNAFMQQKFEPHKHIKEVKFPTLTPIPEQEFLRIYKQYFDLALVLKEGQRRPPAYETYEQKVLKFRKTNSTYYQFKADINHDGEINNVYMVFTMSVPILDFQVRSPFSYGFLLDDKGNYDPRLSGGLSGTPFFYKGRFYLFNDNTSAATVYEPYKLHNKDSSGFFWKTEVCKFYPIIED